MWKDIGKGFKQDEAGNRLQPSGAIEPKACSHCGGEFSSPIQETKITQPVPLYRCSYCGFESNSADITWDHERQNPAAGHAIRKIVAERIAAIERRAIGKLAKVVYQDSEPLVLCSHCLTGAQV